MNPHYATFDTYSINSNPLGVPFGPPDEPVVGPALDNRPATARTRVPVLARIAELESPSTPALAVHARPPMAPPADPQRPVETQHKIETPRRSELRRDPADSKFRTAPLVQPAPAPVKPTRAPAPKEQLNHWPLQVSVALAAYARWIVLVAALIAAGLTLLVIERGAELNDTNLNGPDQISAYPSPAVATAAPVTAPPAYPVTVGPTYELPSVPAASGPIKLARTAPRVQAALTSELRLPPEGAATSQPQMAQRPDQPATSTTR
jgi:hypothetical protein